MEMKRRPTGTNGLGGKTISSNVIISNLDSFCTAAAVLADELATQAARTGRASDARAAIHLYESAHHAWQAAEALTDCEVA